MAKGRKAISGRGQGGWFRLSVFADAGGSVLMETVVALPLYFMLLGGIFWIGDLVLARQRTAIADRYLCWNRANAHVSSSFSLDGLSDDIGERLFGSYVLDRIELGSYGLRVSPLSHSWSSSSFGVVTAKLQMPIWTRGLLATQQVHGPEENQLERVLLDEQTVAGRVVQGQGSLLPLWHVIFSRNDYPDRYKPSTASELADPEIWQWIYSEWMVLVDYLEQSP